MASLPERMIGAAKLDVHIYEEVEADKGAIGQALLVVVLSSIAGGIGAAAGSGEMVAMVIMAGVYTIVDLIGNTRTAKGLRVEAKLDKRKYPTGAKPPTHR